MDYSGGNTRSKTRELTSLCNADDTPSMARAGINNMSEERQLERRLKAMNEEFRRARLSRARQAAFDYDLVDIQKHTRMSRRRRSLPPLIQISPPEQPPTDKRQSHKKRCKDFGKMSEICTVSEKQSGASLVEDKIDNREHDTKGSARPTSATLTVSGPGKNVKRRHSHHFHTEFDIIRSDNTWKTPGTRGDSLSSTSALSSPKIPGSDLKDTEHENLFGAESSAAATWPGRRDPPLELSAINGLSLSTSSRSISPRPKSGLTSKYSIKLDLPHQRHFRRGSLRPASATSAFSTPVLPPGGIRQQRRRWSMAEISDTAMPSLEKQFEELRNCRYLRMPGDLIGDKE